MGVLQNQDTFMEDVTRASIIEVSPMLVDEYLPTWTALPRPQSKAGRNGFYNCIIGGYVAYQVFQTAKMLVNAGRWDDPACWRVYPEQMNVIHFDTAHQQQFVDIFAGMRPLGLFHFPPSPTGEEGLDYYVEAVQEVLGCDGRAILFEAMRDQTKGFLTSSGLGGTTVAALTGAYGDLFLAGVGAAWCEMSIRMQIGY
jgi:hypothetical protein